MRSLRKLMLLLCASLAAVAARPQESTVVLQEPGFPAVDSVPVATSVLNAAFQHPRMVAAAQLSDILDQDPPYLLVLPYGSAYPEAAWPALLRYLERGGNLIVLGGKPFSRAAYKDDNGWHLRAESSAATLELYIAEYQDTEGSASLRFAVNRDVLPSLPPFAWKRAFSPVIRLSVSPMYPREGGSTGEDNAAITTLAWGMRVEHPRAAPAILIDHFSRRFVNGRWIFLTCEPESSSSITTQLLASLRELALRRSDRFTLRPRVPVFAPGEALELYFELEGRKDGQDELPKDILNIRVSGEDGAASHTLDVPADSKQPIVLPAEFAEGQGMHRVDVTRMRAGKPFWRYHTGFWMRDHEYLAEGPKLTVGRDYFQLDGKPLPVVGTTYMASDVDRLYLTEPNVATWDRDMAQIRAAGIRMVRTGVWSGWPQLTHADGSFTEEALRAVEAYLMTARHHGLAVQFNLFAFAPEDLGGENPYLDPVALTAQDHYVRSIAELFHDVPFLAWDLINEPSANNNLWHTLPQGDPLEQKAWRDWLAEHYKDRDALLSAWSETPLGMGRSLQLTANADSPLEKAQDPLLLPIRADFDSEAIRNGGNPLKVYDYFRFTQDVFAKWAARQKQTIRETGSQQLITIGQDEGGWAARISPTFLGSTIDFTANHSWWDYDSILWASLAAKFSDKPMLLQEMGEQRRRTQDNLARLSPDEEKWQLERKYAISFAQGAGGIEWVWNVNALEANDNETTIGAIRPDGTEKPEVDAIEGIAAFAKKSPDSFTEIEAPPVAVIASQGFLYSDMNGIVLAAEKKSLRALCYVDHTPARLVWEDRLEDLASTRLAILAAPQSLTEAAWKSILEWVRQGNTLLVTGPVARDEHWQFIDRTTPLHIEASVRELSLRQSTLHIPGQEGALQVTYPANVQQSPIEMLRFANGESVEKIEYGNGRILWAADPVELAENYEPAAALYRYALGVAGIAAPYRQLQPLSPGVLAYPTVLKTAVLYSFSSESMEDEAVDIVDEVSHAHLRFTLPSQRGALVLLRKSDGKVLSSYGVDLQ